MYKFKDLTTPSDSSGLPSCAMIFNGQYLEDLIPGYMTLNVSGRETISNNLQALTGIPSRDGALVLDCTLPPRILEIEYRIQAEDSAALQECYRQLRSALDAPAKIGFLDDPGIVYYGQLSGMNDIPPDRNTIIGSFSIFCADPYKYAAESTPIVGNPAIVYFGGPYPVKPDEIKITLTASSTGIIVANTTTGRRIILTGTYVNGDIIRIKPTAENQGDRITKNGANAMAALDYLASDFGAFLVRDGDTITVTPASAVVSTAVRARWK